MKLRMAITVGTAVLASMAAASPALADVSYSQPIVGTGCTLHTHLSTTVDPQGRPPFDPSGTNVGYTGP